MCQPQSTQTVLASVESLGTFWVSSVKSTERNVFFISDNNGITTLWLSQGFKRLFLPLVNDIIIYEGENLEELKLYYNCNDYVVREECGDRIIQLPTTIAGQLISMLSKQPKGQNGEMANDGHSNLFYFEKEENAENVLCCVHALWCVGTHRWNLYAYVTADEVQHKDDKNVDWPENTKIFSPVS